MYLKKIEAQGFKSFADKINIELESGITGVVGPNGSGKSNIVDAIRWVMGEQSIKSLRGSDNIDVIFSGSKSRNAAGMATVSLIFDNKDKYLPFEYDEVSIKRRLYKDGTNEYFLNNTKCRLKDITNLLIDSGVAKESFNIIGQGKIEEIISSKSVERRTIFEEAAGVLKYKKRKEEATRKLDKTHVNMERVEDIIKELENSINPLKEEKEKAILYNDINDKLTKLDISLTANQITSLNNRYLELKKIIEDLNNEIIKYTAKISTKDSELLKLKSKLMDINNKLNNQNELLLQKTHEVEKLNSERLLIIERKKYDENIPEKAIINLKEELHNLTINLSNKENEIALLEKDLSLLKEEINKNNESLNKIFLTRNEIEKNLQKALLNKNKIEIDINKLEEIIQENANIPYPVRMCLNNPKLQINNTISSVIEVENKYQKAISVALSAQASYLVCDNKNQAKDAINYLKENKLGRATFYPLDTITPKYLKEEINYLGYINTANKLVKYEPKYENIISNQLGLVLVFDNLNNALLAHNKLNYKYKIVTLSGEVLNIGGSLTGGENKNNKNPISDKYILQEHINNLNNLIKDIAKLEDDINIQDYEYSVIKDKLFVLEKDYNIKNNNLKFVQDELKVINNKYDETNNTLLGAQSINQNTLDKMEEDVLNKYYLAVEDKNKLEQEISILRKDQTKLISDIDYNESINKKENSEYNHKINELKDLEIEKNRLDVKLDNLLNNLNENYNMTYEKAKDNFYLEMDVEQAKKEVSKYKNSLKELGVVNLGAISEYNRISQRYEFLIKQREDLNKAENILLEIINEMDNVMKDLFKETFALIKENFTKTFQELFHGGYATLELTEPNNLLETGIDIVAMPPGKKLSTITLLSGGEKSLTALSLLFAILKTKEVPFVILDEVEAALDEVNVTSFGEYINNLKEKSQFIVITHKKKTMEFTDTLYGITMQESGVSKLVSVRLEDMKK